MIAVLGNLMEIILDVACNLHLTSARAEKVNYELLQN